MVPAIDSHASAILTYKTALAKYFPGAPPDTSKESGRWPAECGMPTAAKLTNVEITQARNLGVEFLAVRQRRTDLHPWHGSHAGRWREVGLPLFPLAIW